MDKSTVRAIATVLNGVLIDLMIDGKLSAPALAARSLRQVADQIEAANPPKQG